MILLIIILPKLQLQKEPEMISLTPHYYKDGVEVFPTKGFFGFTIVTPPGESYDQILFDINGVSTGDIPFSNIRITDASPTAFKNALPSTIQSLNRGQIKKLWGEGDYIAMNTIQFESISPVNFWVEVSAVNDYTGETIYADRSYSGDISFGEEEKPMKFTSPIESEVISGTALLEWTNDGYWPGIYLQYAVKYPGCYEFGTGGWNDLDGPMSSSQTTYNWDTTTVSNEDYCIRLISGTNVYDAVWVSVESPATNWFYQENADEISCEGSWDGTQTCALTTDGDWDTYGQASSGISYVYITYVKPIGALSSSTWEFKSTSIESNPVPSSCWDYDTNQLMFAVRSDSSGEISRGYCLNNNGWNLITGGGSKDFYEEAMNWEIDGDSCFKECPFPVPCGVPCP